MKDLLQPKWKIMLSSTMAWRTHSSVYIAVRLRPPRSWEKTPFTMQIFDGKIDGQGMGWAQNLFDFALSKNL